MAPVRQLSALEDSLVGASCGALEVLIMQPSVYWKTELQQRRFSLARALNPRFAYRGVWVAAGSCAPITGIQFSVNGSCLRALSRAGSSEPSNATKMASGMLAGMASALVQSPCQLVEINQQKHGGNMFSTGQRIYNTYGLRGFGIGYTMTAIREGIFVCGYMAALPILRQSLTQRWDIPEPAATASAGVIAGVVSAVLSHPADTLKTRIQGSMFPEAGDPSRSSHEKPSLRAALTSMRASGGSILAQCYGGAVPRLFRIVSCGFIYDALRRRFEMLARQVDSARQLDMCQYVPELDKVRTTPGLKAQL
eukprot:TRINITY_DN36621_c0_g1_i1.p1 TRINITY_DN36621_c0_g1~~TRINITY_DN36621_c0_g1_i1.p1  ORF type:complete len:326 (+),score=50.89 TRINITY_DN36621_c0_g1_i1:54-980(+)